MNDKYYNKKVQIRSYKSIQEYQMTHKQYVIEIVDEDLKLSSTIRRFKDFEFIQEILLKEHE